MVAGADADALAAEDLGDVVRVDAVERERDHAPRRVEVARAVDRRGPSTSREALERVADDVALVLPHGVHAEAAARKSTAAPRPTASAIGDVPASNFAGSSA